MRKCGKKFEFSEHLETLLTSLLYNHRLGNLNIKKNYQKIKEIFHYYNKEELENEYGSLDNYVLSKNPNEIANSFSEGKYSLKQVGKVFVFDYLKRVGINTCKPSIQLQKLFGCNRLNIVDNKLVTKRK